jgi:hypothetical protein
MIKNQKRRVRLDPPLSIGGPRPTLPYSFCHNSLSISRIGLRIASHGDFFKIHLMFNILYDIIFIQLIEYRIQNSGDLVIYYL